MEELTLEEILKGIWKRKLIIIICTVVFLILGVLIVGKTEEQPLEVIENEIVKYAQTSFSVVVKADEKINSEVVGTYLNVLKSKTKLEALIEKYELENTVKELEGAIRIRTIERSNVIEISIIDENFVDNAIEILSDLTVMFEAEIEKIYGEESFYLIDAPYLNEIEEEKTIKVINKEIDLKKVIIVTLAGIVIGVAGAVALELLDNKVKNEKQLQSLNLYNLATVSSKKDLTSELRKVKLNLKENKVIVVSNLTKKTIDNIINELVELYAKYEKNVKLIDLTNEEIDVYDVKYKKDSIDKKKVDNKYNLVELLESKEIKKVLDEMKENNFVIINANSVCESVNSLSVTRFADATIGVVEERKTKVEEVENMITKLEKNDSKIMGTIFVKK